MGISFGVGFIYCVSVRWVLTDNVPDAATTLDYWHVGHSLDILAI